MTKICDTCQYYKHTSYVLGECENIPEGQTERIITAPTFGCAEWVHKLEREILDACKEDNFPCLKE